MIVSQSLSTREILQQTSLILNATVNEIEILISGQIYSVNENVIYACVSFFLSHHLYVCNKIYKMQNMVAYSNVELFIQRQGNISVVFSKTKG